MKAGLEDCMYLCSLLYRSLLVDNVILFLILRLITMKLGHIHFSQLAPGTWQIWSRFICCTPV